jgi:hypothetical protein
MMGVSYQTANIFGVYRYIELVPAGTAGPNLVILAGNPGGYYAVAGNFPRMTPGYRERNFVQGYQNFGGGGGRHRR